MREKIFMKSARILIVDDEVAARYGMRKVLKDSVYEIEESSDGESALKMVEQFSPDIVLCDVNMPRMNGIEFLKALKIRMGGKKEPLVIMITAYGSEKIAVEAMKAGAYDYLSKPYEIDDLRFTIRKALEKLELVQENIELKKKIKSLTTVFIIGESPVIKNVLNLIEKVAQTDVTVLVTGGSGTGKELVAHTIHEKSLRISGPFVSMNCAAIPKDLVESELFGHERGAFTGAISQRKGKFEIADQGTLFLDEIADMSIETQAKILRVLEEKSFARLGGKSLISSDVRLVSATNKDLVEEIKEGRFREDLYYRLKVVEIRLPLLTERREDIPLLANSFLHRFNTKYKKNVNRINVDAMKTLQNYEWPGNVRQLMNLIEQCVVLSDTDYIGVEHLPSELAFELTEIKMNTEFGKFSFRDAKQKATKQIEYSLIDQALKRTAGNVSEAARQLKMKRQFLQQKMKVLGLQAAEYKIVK